VNLKRILLGLLDAAVAKWPAWAGLFNVLRPWLVSHLPVDDGVVVVGGVGAAPDGIKTLVLDFLNGLVDKANGLFIKLALKAFIRVVPSLLDLAWDSLFPGEPKALMMAAEPVEDFSDVVVSVS
jgi:hypothetical protein